MMTCQELGALLRRVRAARPMVEDDQPLLDLSECDLAALEFICKLLPEHVVESLEWNDAPLWGEGAIKPEAFLTRDEKAWTCPVDSQECAIRRMCTNKCGQYDTQRPTCPDSGELLELARLRVEIERLRDLLRDVSCALGVEGESDETIKAAAWEAFGHMMGYADKEKAT